MKNKKQLTIILILLVLIALIGRIIIYSGIFDKIYPTINDAVTNKYSISKKSIIGVLEDNDCSLVLVNINQSIKFEYLCKVENGWKFITRQVQGSEKYSRANIDKYGFDYDRYNNKSIFTIYSPLNKKPDFNMPKDDMDSDFQYLNYINLGVESEIWFLVLDELPNNYTIQLGNESIKIN